MRVTAHVILLLTAVLLLGADGPGGANPSATAPPKDAARPPMTREEAIDALKGLGVKVASVATWDGRQRRECAVPQRPNRQWTFCRRSRTCGRCDWSRSRSLTPILLAFGAKSELTKLTLASAQIKGEGLKYLTDSKKLQYLNLGGTALGDEGLKNLSGMTALETLLLPKVSASGLAAIKPLKALKYLTLWEGVDDDGLTQLRGAQSLERVGPLTRVSDAGMRDLGTMRALKELDLHLNTRRVTDAGIAQLAGLLHLERLDLHGTEITDTGIEHVGRLRSLKYLALGGPGITDAALPRIVGLKLLDGLDLADTKVTDAGLSQLTHLPLHYLGLERTRITDAGLRQVAKLPLYHLGLEGTRITDAGLAEIKDMPELNDLRLRSTAVTDAGMGQVEKMCALRDLDVVNTAVTRATASAIERRMGIRVMAGSSEIPPENQTDE